MLPKKIKLLLNQKITINDSMVPLLFGGLEPWNFMTFHKLGMYNPPN
jgi:hypothetical protein